MNNIAYKILYKTCADFQEFPKIYKSINFMRPLFIRILVITYNVMHIRSKIPIIVYIHIDIYNFHTTFFKVISPNFCDRHAKNIQEYWSLYSDFIFLTSTVRQSYRCCVPQAWDHVALIGYLNRNVLQYSLSDLTKIENIFQSHTRVSGRFLINKGTLSLRQAHHRRIEHGLAQKYFFCIYSSTEYLIFLLSVWLNPRATF